MEYLEFLKIILKIFLEIKHLKLQSTNRLIYGDKTFKIMKKHDWNKLRELKYIIACIY